MFEPKLREPEQDIQIEELPEEEREEAEEIIKEVAAGAAPDENNNMYYNKIKQKQQELIECIESDGAKDKHGKPCGFRRV